MQANRETGPTLRRASALLPILLMAGACKPPPDEKQFLPFASLDRGRAAIERAGCGACHAIDGIDWPRGTVAPPLHDFADRALIAGRLPNRPDILAAYVRNAPALVPGTAMPAMPISEAEARDIASFLYAPGAR